MVAPCFNLDDILQRAAKLQPLSAVEIKYLLKLKKQDDWRRIFQLACSLRNRFFGNKIFLYGFVYFTTWCRNECTFCYYRKSNDHSRRYRKSEQEVLAAAGRLAESGVHLIDLTMGEDPFYYHQVNGFAPLIDLVEKIKNLTGLPLMISPGVVSEQVLHALATAGADWYACYQETHNRRLFSQLRVRQSYNRRWMAKTNAMRSGMLVEEGILAGVGESPSDIAVSMISMRNLGAQQLRVMSFVPQAGTPMAKRPTPSRLRELQIIAVLRLLFPERLIPASLDVDGIAGLQMRINAGANVITSLIPADSGLAGVAQCSKDIREGYRTVAGVKPYLDQMGLQPATASEYSEWVKNEQTKLTMRRKAGAL